MIFQSFEANLRFKIIPFDVDNANFEITMPSSAMVQSAMTTSIGPIMIIIGIQNDPNLELVQRQFRLRRNNQDLGSGLWVDYISSFEYGDPPALYHLFEYRAELDDNDEGDLDPVSESAKRS